MPLQIVVTETIARFLLFYGFLAFKYSETIVCAPTGTASSLLVAVGAPVLENALPCEEFHIASIVFAPIFSAQGSS